MEPRNSDAINQIIDINTPLNIATVNINTDRLLEDLRHLATFGRCGTGVNRRSLSEDDMASRHWLCKRMREAGLHATIDGVGNVIGRTPHSRRIIIGSHSDTVPNGGWLDGAMGVIYGLEIARAVMEQADQFDIGVEAISFIDEESRFAPLLGSRVFCGEITDHTWSDVASEDGVSLAEQLELAGLSERPIQRLDASQHVGYLEAHIEQGPVLEAHDERIGVVMGIVGASLFRVRFRGKRNHAGTTPMPMRKDAALAMFDFAQQFRAFCAAEANPDTVWTFSKVRTEPEAHNVIPDYAECTLQYRDVSQETLDRLDGAVERICLEVSAATGVDVTNERMMQLNPTMMNEHFVNLIEGAAQTCGVSSRRMPSRAGHDAMVLGRYIPAGMLFIPSIGGLSHDVKEDTSETDIRLGAVVFALATSQILSAKAG